MAIPSKYKSSTTQVVQQFAHAMRWADGNDDRLQQLRDALQALVQPVASAPTQPLPDWFVQPDKQLEQQESWLRSLGFDQGDIPTSGPDIVPCRNALPLLRVVMPRRRSWTRLQRTVEVHLAAIEELFIAAGQHSFRSLAFREFQGAPEMAPGLAQPAPGVSWVLYDPFTHWDPQNGHRVSFLNSVTGEGWSLAGSECLSALKVWPQYGPAVDGTTLPYINLAGHRTAGGGVPYVDRLSDGKLVFGGGSAGRLGYTFASPRFREC